MSKPELCVTCKHLVGCEILDAMVLNFPEPSMRERFCSNWEEDEESE